LEQRRNSCAPARQCHRPARSRRPATSKGSKWLRAWQAFREYWQTAAGSDDLVDAVRRLEALKAIRRTKNFEPLAVSFKRIRNILEKAGARGRLDLAGTSPTGAPIFIDYAHTPDALAKALDALRPYVKSRLLVVFGCGGDRDRGKRPEMGAVAQTKADVVVVTDDNPRSEEPSAIRRAILASAPSASEVADRGTAVARAVAQLRPGDVLLVAGKGHESGQIVGQTVIPYSDHDAVAAALQEGAPNG